MQLLSQGLALPNIGEAKKVSLNTQTDFFF